MASRAVVEQFANSAAVKDDRIRTHIRTRTHGLILVPVRTFQTYVANILIAVNPYFEVKHYYTHETITKYKGNAISQEKTGLAWVTEEMTLDVGGGVGAVVFLMRFCGFGSGVSSTTGG